MARCRACTTRAAGLTTVAAGLALVGMGTWARRDVGRALGRERITSTSGAAIRGAADARAMAEVIRENTLSSTHGRTYSEVEPYVDVEGRPTGDRALAATDAVTGAPVESPQHALWIQSTALQTALVQAYLAQRLAELTIALGAVFVGVGAGLASSSR